MFVNMKDKCDIELDEKITSWHFWCRLCSNNNEETKIRIFHKDEEDGDRDLFVDVEKLEYSKNTRIKDAMLRYFDINIAEHQEVPTYLCHECYSLLASLVQFTEIVNKTQNMFKYLFKKGQIMKKDLKSIREQFEFYDESIYSFKNLLDGFELELSFEKEEEEKPEENPLDLNDTNQNKNINISESNSEISSYDGSSDSDYEFLSLKSAKNKLYNCGKCRDKFETDQEYRTHLRIEHPKDNHQKEPIKKKNDGVFICPHCQEDFKSNTKKNLHIKAMHSNVKSYVCDQCGFVMNSSRSLRQHVLTHTDLAAYSCPTCNKNFKQKVGLKV